MNNVIRISDYQYKNMYKAEIDVAADLQINIFTEFCEKYNLQANLIAAQGPGGGNPCFELTCSNKNELIMALADFHQTTIDDPFILEGITK